MPRKATTMTAMTTTNGSRKKNTAVYLTNEQKYQIYKICAEQRFIVVKNGHVQFRVFKKVILDEINAMDLLEGKKINDYHVNSAVKEIVGWQDLLSMGVDFKETAEVEQIREQHIRDQKQIETLKLEVSNLKDQLEYARNAEGNINDLKQRLADIRRRATV